MSRRIGMLVAIWSGAAALGFWSMLHYELTPAATVQATERWPAETGLTRAADQPTLIVFIHPHCPCSRASLAELNRLVSSFDGHVALRIVMVKPTGMEDGWEQTDLVESARAIPGAAVSFDPGGREAERFGATTSGECLLYAQDGRLLFQGGLTASRGHEGDSAGKESLAELVRTGHSGIDRTAIYGCSLFTKTPSGRTLAAKTLADSPLTNSCCSRKESKQP